jgi:mannose-1-phosphate guanylyltransferase/mannose-1-phosphate guanylyltransferase/mannose-6-phosphate isomerase
MFNDCVIMAGGSGTRLWPASSGRLPKQFLPAGNSTDGRSFFNAALDRALAVTAAGNSASAAGRVIIVAGTSHISHVVKACAPYPARDLARIVLIPEPEAKNTAPAIACAAFYAQLTGGENRTILVLTSDHIIEPLERFTADAAAAEVFTRTDRLAVFGIKPRGAETGYGYIETGDLLSFGKGGPGGAARVFAVTAFREKPDRALAEQFVSAGNFFWNSGMFAFQARFILKEFAEKAPSVAGPFEKLRAPDEKAYKTAEGLRVLREWPGLREAYKNARAISFDYAIAEKCGATVMVEAAFNWTDVGSWDEYALLAGREDGAAGGNSRTPGTELFQTGAVNCFVDSDIPVALIGTEDLIVTARSGKNGEPPAILISKRGESQKVRDIVAHITAKGRKELL